MTRRARAPRVTCAILLGASMLASPSLAVAADDGEEVTAYLDGRRIPVSDVSRYYCDDFSYPVIECSKSKPLIETRATLVALLTSADYVTIYDYTTFQGGSMNVSQDYATLLTVGWSDKISSFRARNGETGTFYTDWFFNGSTWSFCCNTQQSSLGAYNNTFSSIQRT